MNKRLVIAMFCIIIAFDVILAILVCCDIITKRPVVMDGNIDELINDTELDGTFYWNGEKYIVIER